MIITIIIIIIIIIIVVVVVIIINYFYKAHFDNRSCSQNISQKFIQRMK